MDIVIVDSSALLAIFYEEPEGDAFLHRISRAKLPRISAVSYTEASVVLLRQRGKEAVDELHALMRSLGLITEVVTANQATLAYEAYGRFGKGLHPARLNLGDCFAYALAVQYGEPLLFKGNDFGQTDVLVA